MRVLVLFKGAQLLLSVAVVVLLLVPTQICFPDLTEFIPNECYVAVQAAALPVSGKQRKEVEAYRHIESMNKNGCSLETQAPMNATVTQKWNREEKIGVSSLLSVHFCVETTVKQRYCDGRWTYPGDPGFCLDQRMFVVPTVLAGGICLLISMQLIWMIMSKSRKYIDRFTNFFCCLLWLITAAVLLFERMEWSRTWREDWIGQQDSSRGNTPSYPVPWSMGLLVSAFLFAFHVLEVITPSHWQDGHVQVFSQEKETYQLTRVVSY